VAEGHYDVVHLEHLRGAELVRGLRADSPAIVFDAVDSIALLFERAAQNAARWQSRLLARLDLNRTRRYEGEFTQRFSRVLVTSPEDRDALVALAAKQAGEGESRSKERPIVLPNGVDLDFFAPLEEPHEPDTVVFTGKMSYHANTAAVLDLVQSIMPHVWAKRPQTQVWLVGKDPPDVLRELAKDRRVTVTGTVPDIRPYLGRATVSVSPLRYGVGIQNKVLEAMAMGIPVVTTSDACRALMVQPGSHLLVGDSAPELAQATLSLLANGERRDRHAAAGRNYIETHHNWGRIAAQLESVYQETINDQSLARHSVIPVGITGLPPLASL
jgi:glycosyltransferase involved in cell wall biosynthesis